MPAPISWTVLWAACFAAAAPRPMAALLRGAAAASGSLHDLAGQARLSVVDWNAYDERDQDGPGTYSFGYEIEDAPSANTQFRQEERLANGTVVGSYGLVEPDGNVRVVNYVADAQGYRVRIENSLRKNENFPPPSAAPPSPPWQQRRPLKRPTDRLLDADPGPDGQPPPPPASPLTWALLALQGGGRRPPLQEQRLRPASAAQHAQPRPGHQRRGDRAEDAGRVHGEELSLRQIQQQQQQQLQQQQQQQEQLQQQQQLQQVQQQQQQWRDGQAWYRSQGYLPGDTVLRYAQQDGGQDAELLSNKLAPAPGSARGDDADPRTRTRSWTSAPIVVWPAPAAAPTASAPPFLLPPIPALDKLIYKRDALY